MIYLRNFLPVAVLLFCGGVVFGGNIKGKVTDANTGESLPGATIMIDGTNRGTISDLRGEFIIAGIEDGTHTLICRFIGYEEGTVEVRVNPGIPTDITISLSSKAIQGEEVIVTAQAAGQRAAMNQQIASNSVKNVVSAQRIQEVPESSAAEAVGRLPGVSLKNGSLVIRGLSPHYNKIQIDGTDMASTNFDDRSSSLGMISQYMLEGIEMTKTAMADHDADVFGARVNLIIKEAPLTPTFEVLFQNGYNTLSESFGNQKFVLSGSNRFLDNRLGVFAQVNFERAETAQNSMTSNYFKATEGAEMSSMALKDSENSIGRKGASLVMDYKSGLTKIKMSNFLSSSSTESVSRNAGYSSGNENETRSMDLNASELLVMTNSLRIEQVLGPLEIDGGINYSYSKNDIPEKIKAEGTDIAAISDSVDWQAHPREIPSWSTFNLQEAFMQNFTYNYKSGTEKRYTADLNIKTNLRLADWLNLDLKAGAKYRRQKKTLDDENYRANMQNASFQRTRDVAEQYVDWFPEASEAGSTEGGMIGLRYFVDPDYYNSEHLLGDYVLSDMLDVSLVREFHEFMLDNPMDFAFGEGEPYNKIWKTSYEGDYYGDEDYLAGYIKPTFVFGNNNKLTLIPGLRYEQNQTSYTGYRLPQISADGAFRRHPEFAEHDVTRDRENQFLLPMLHIIYRPFNWFSLKTSYTHTLSRPKFADIIPSWSVGNDFIAWNNPYLEPALSKNIDLQLSAHSSKLGLLAIGAFYKTIDNLIFMHGETKILQSDLDEGIYDGLEYNDQYTLMNTAGFGINYEMNNPEESYVSGIEIEYQSNFYFLPGVLSGLVLNVNYTLFDSDAKYPSVIRELDYQTFQYTYRDTTYSDRLLDQATHIFNVMIGFDYKGFSIRGSMKYTDDLFSSYNQEPLLRKYTDKRIDYDISIVQRWSKIGLSAFCNLTNLSRSRYVVLNSGSGYPTLERYGGLGIALGLRYRFRKDR
ncbi:MAG: TonB-dependent receptor plug domain-containing protein [Bacteroidetes bacterium]|nr:TonB-dependent receptor plug domain-containing protein [Bacteroidota bacterium]